MLSHNDLLGGNIIVLPTGDDVRFIDFEYGGPGYAAFDIANHFSEWAGFECDWSRVPSRSVQSAWVRTYLEALPADHVPRFYNEESLLADVRRCGPAVQLFWAIWSLLQSTLSEIEFDYTDYASRRMLRFEELLVEAKIMFSPFDNEKDLRINDTAPSLVMVLDTIPSLSPTSASSSDSKYCIF